MKAARWFQRNVSFLKTSRAKTVKTASETTSWITFSWKSEKGPSVVDEADAVGRHLAAVFEEGDAPAHQNDNEERQRIAGSHLVEFQVAVPGDGHEGVGTEQQQNGIKSSHECDVWFCGAKISIAP